MHDRKVLLTFDLEEFDIANEYGSKLSWEEQIEIGRKGMDAIVEVLNLHNVPTTIFTTAAYALENKEQVRKLAATHEIASHTYFHSSFSVPDLLKSKTALEELTGKPVTGLRMPRLRPINMIDVRSAGYFYDSSINPTIIPGKYNNLHLPKSMYMQQEVYRIPCSVSPTFRIPLFWLTFKNFPYSIYRKMLEESLNSTQFVNLYFHPWEFTDISNYKLPFYVKRPSGNQLVNKLHTLISDLKQMGQFETMQRFIEEW